MKMSNAEAHFINNIYVHVHSNIHLNSQNDVTDVRIIGGRGSLTFALFAFYQTLGHQR